MGYLLEYLGIQRFTEFEYPFLMAATLLVSDSEHRWYPQGGRAKIPAFTGKWQEIFMLAVITLHPGKTQVEVTTVQIFVYNVQYIWTPIPIILLAPIIPFAYQFLEMRFHAPIILVFTGDSGCINISVLNAGRYHILEFKRFSKQQNDNSEYLDEDEDAIRTLGEGRIYLNEYLAGKWPGVEKAVIINDKIFCESYRTCGPIRDFRCER